jgi:hypothetical protein
MIPVALCLFAVASVSCAKADSSGTVTVYTKIDDMEGQGGRIAWSPRDGWPSGLQAGYWTSSTDCSDRDDILPAPYFVDPSGWSYDRLPKAHATMSGAISTNAVHLRTKMGKPLQGIWGANVGFDFAEAIDVEVGGAADGAVSGATASSGDAGGVSDGVLCTNGSSRDFNGVPVDLRAFSGLTFWAMAQSTGRQSIRVQINDPHTDPRANLCSSSRDTDKDNCYNSFGKAFMLTDTLTQYWLDFSELRQPNWGYRFGLDPIDLQHVYSLNFLVALPGCADEKSEANCAGEPAPVSFDIWIDDLYFVNRP